jgi:predicted anti-sigma-YlaC factor YlaD
MKTSGIPNCKQVQMAAMAHLDRERADLAPVEVEAHVASCAECRAAIAAMTTLQERLNQLDYESLDADVWPGLRHAITSETPQPRPESRFVFALAASLALWRLAQLTIDLPAPVVNSVVPLALTVLVLWRVTGDPFAIQVTAHQLQQEGVR